MNKQKVTRTKSKVPSKRPSLLVTRYFPRQGAGFRPYLGPCGQRRPVTSQRSAALSRVSKDGGGGEQVEAAESPQQHLHGR